MGIESTSFKAGSAKWKGNVYMPLSSAMADIGSAEQLISEWLPASGFSAILAKRGDGKTLALLDQGLSFATDKDWKGYKTTRGRFVVYLCGEDQPGTIANARAWYVRNGIDPTDPKTRFMFVDTVPNLLHEGECREMISHIRQSLPANARCVTYIDTWQRATADIAQNDDQGANVAIKHVEMIGRELGGPVCVACHPPKGNSKTIAGPMVVENSSMAIWKMRPLTSDKKTGRELEVERIKGAGLGTRCTTKIAALDLGGFDQHGNPVTGAVLVKPGEAVVTAAVEELRMERVARLRAAGRKPEEIADEVGISVQTVYRDLQKVKAAA